MLDNTGTRQLCYVVKIDSVKPIPGRDRVECCKINGWTVMTRRDQFKPGDLGIYFEIDSKTPETEPFGFLAGKHYKIKTQGYKTPDGKFYSQGLLMSADDFGGMQYQDGDGQFYLHFGKDSYFKENVDMGEGEFLTKKLGVTYAIAEDNKRKAKVHPDAKIDAALARHPKFAKKYGKVVKKNKFLRWFFTTIWGGTKVAKATAFPTQFPFVHKSDEERCENMTWVLEDKSPFVKTTKIDGTSTLFVLERKPFNKREFYVCSRNVRQLTPDQKTFFNTENVYWQVENKFHIRDFLEKMLNDHPEWTYVALQGETAGLSENGEKIQGDPHQFGELRFFGYNFIDSVKGRWGSVEARDLTAQYGIEWVPIVDENYILPDDFEEFKKSADGPCEAKGAHGAREGYVYRNVADPNLSFKNVSRIYLAKHNG